MPKDCRFCLWILTSTAYGVHTKQLASAGLDEVGADAAKRSQSFAGVGHFTEGGQGTAVAELLEGLVATL